MWEVRRAKVVAMKRAKVREQSRHPPCKTVLEFKAKLLLPIAPPTAISSHIQL